MVLLFFLFIYVSLTVSVHIKLLIFSLILWIILALKFESKIIKKILLDLSLIFIIFLLILKFSILGPSLILLGTLLNMIVVVANSGMPVSEKAYNRQTYLPLDEALFVFGLKKRGYIKLEPDSRFPYLADILSVPGIGIISIGDVFIFLGEGYIVTKYFLSS